ncbi:hypothetical protein C5E10_10970 [Pseudoclavibacter sp. RFBG4]|uniref:nuclear transport factor 2 family protein n=1 Tax=Pseudoclavibacter sp. RFBG4 TaxID=2080575 RepID=UPI000CE7634E|nr:nuclear transport factor 2 family protein [Pseudoclavibacter sp. RFBG4]PPG31475.1 hypothetical protein C5E10_10970 [Pseudoclavibacter sp. RFBG4]
MSEALDRLEIQELLHRYSLAVDDRRWDLWETLFTGDAVIDFRGSFWAENPQGWGLHSPAELRQILTDSSGPDRITGQHLVLNSIIDLGDDTATAHSEFLAITVRRTADPATWHGGVAAKVSTGGSYDDEFVREGSRWRIRRRASRIRWQSTEQITLPENRR